MECTNELLDRYLDGDCSVDENQQVITWLALCDKNVRHLAERAELHADLRRALQRRNIQQSAIATVATADRLKSRSMLKTALYAALVTAASLLLAFVMIRGNGKESIPPAIASIAYQSQAVWADGERLTGYAMSGGIHELDVGIVRVDFVNGASLTLQGPAVFEVVTADQTNLHSGILTAYIPDTAVGFEIRTPTLEVVDFGTTFGLSVGSNGETDVSVFAGEVEVSVLGNKTRRPPQTVVEGTTIRTRPLSNSIEVVAFETARYEDTWPITSGVLQTTGLMKFVSPGPKFVPGRHEDDDHILVFSERDNVLLQVALAVDLVEAGQYQRINRKERHLVAAGQRVRSYLLQLDPIGRLQRDDPNKSRVIGQITFDRPIIGLIASSTKLHATDDALGHPHGDYGTAPRGIEPHRRVDSTASGRDVVVLSKDQRTLSLDLSAGSAVDQIRVVIAVDPKTSEDP